jgi:hypothetical protein
MAKYDVTFIANVVVDERIEAESEEEAREKAQVMIDEQNVGEHKLDLDWDIEEVELAGDEDLEADPETDLDNQDPDMGDCGTDRDQETTN